MLSSPILSERCLASCVWDPGSELVVSRYFFSGADGHVAAATVAATATAAATAAAATTQIAKATT